MSWVVNKDGGHGDKSWEDSVSREETKKGEENSQSRQRGGVVCVLHPCDVGLGLFALDPKLYPRYLCDRKKERQDEEGERSGIVIEARSPGVVQRLARVIAPTGLTSGHRSAGPQRSGRDLSAAFQQDGNYKTCRLHRPLRH